MSSPLEISSFVLGSIAVVAFGLLAAWIGHKRYHTIGAVQLDTIDFVTARNSLGVMTIAWSLYANAIGAGTAFFPPSYSTIPGIGFVGMISNAIANVIPPLFIAFFGSRIRDQCPEALSLSNYMYKRYGRFVQFFVGLIVAFNMAMALTVEYTAISSIYRDLVGSQYSIIIMLIIGFVTSGYTAYGGLYASLATDRLQGVVGAILILVMVIYTAGFAQLNLGPFPKSLYPETAGWASIFVLPVSILTGTLLSEASFQRAWASVDNKTLKRGAIISSFFILVVVLLFSWGGILVVWSGREVTNPNNVLFGLVGPPYAPTTITVLVVVLTTIMNTAAVDSIQNGLTSVVSSNFFVGRSIWFSRVAAFAMNALCLGIGYQGYSSIVTLFAITNIITTMASVFFAGLFDPDRKYISGAGVVFGFWFAFAWVAVYGWIATGDLGQGFTFVFLQDVYNYPPFLISLTTSWFGLGIFELIRFKVSEKKASHKRLSSEKTLNETQQQVQEEY